MAKRKDSRFDELEPQKSSAAQFLTYIAANGVTNEKFEIRYEDETIWMSQKMLAAVYGVDLRTISYHITRIFKDAELDKGTCIQKYWIHLEDGRNYEVVHYNLKVIIALGFKINNARAVQFRKWANEVVEKFTIQGWALDEARPWRKRRSGPRDGQGEMSVRRSRRTGEKTFWYNPLRIGV